MTNQKREVQRKLSLPQNDAVSSVAERHLLGRQRRSPCSILSSRAQRDAGAAFHKLGDRSEVA